MATNIPLNNPLFNPLTSTPPSPPPPHPTPHPLTSTSIRTALIHLGLGLSPASPPSRNGDGPIMPCTSASAPASATPSVISRQRAGTASDRPRMTRSVDGHVIGKITGLRTKT